MSFCRGGQVESPSQRRRGDDGAEEGSETSRNRHTHKHKTASSKYASPSTNLTTTVGGVHSVLSRLALTSSPSSPYHTPGSSPTRDKSRNRYSSKFNSFLEKKTTAITEHTQDSPQAARTLAMTSPPPRLDSSTRGRNHNKTPGTGRNLDISEL